MRILFVTPAYKPAYCYGGPTISVSELAENLTAAGHAVTVYTTTANGKTELDVPVNCAADLNGVTVYYFKRMTGDHTHVSPALWKKLWVTQSGFDIIHLQSWWSFLIIGAAAICRFRGTPFILSPRGMLGEYSFRHQHNLSKKLIHQLFGKKLLQKSVLHATTLLEWKDCTSVYANWKGFVLPNLVNLPSVQPMRSEDPNAIFTIGFLSRIDPKKGIELLFQALSKVSFTYRLRIAGSGSDDYISTLKALASGLGMAEKIEWCGWMQGENKFTFLKQLDLFVLTSYNENFAIAVTESLSMGTAVLVSEGVGLADYVKEKEVGFVCQTNATDIELALNKIHKGRNDLLRIREEAPKRIAEDFDKQTLAEKYVKAYQNIVSNTAGTEVLPAFEEAVF